MKKQTTHPANRPMKHLLIAVAGLALVMPMTASAQGTEYVSSGFSAEITDNGEVKNLKVGDHVLMNHLYLVGDYRDALAEKDHDARFYQFQEKSPATIQSSGDDTLIVEKTNAVLRNEKYPEGAIYNEKITFTPNRIRLEYELETGVPFDSHAGVFSTLCELPLSLAGVGYKVTNREDSETLGIIPVEYSESDKLRAIARKLAIAIPGGIVTIEGDEDTSLLFADARAWNESALRLNIDQRVPWHPNPVTIPAGTKTKWAFTITYEPEQN